MAQIYLGQWEWFTDPVDGTTFWRSPNGNAVSGFDLRSLPECGQKGGSPGHGLFVYPSPVSHPLLVEDMGSDLEALLSARSMGVINSSLKVGLARDTVINVIRQMLLDPSISDPTGQTRWKPLREGRVSLGGFGRIIDENIGHQARIAIFRADYTRNREWVNAATGQEAEDRLNSLRRWTGFTLRKIHGRMDDALAIALLPDPYKGDGWLRPSTAISESFNQADSTTLGPDLTWAEPAGNAETRSNEVGSVSGVSRGRAEHDLSSDEHQAELDLTFYLGSENGGPCSRYASAADTCYVYLLDENAGATSTDVHRLFKIVAGSLTLLANGPSEAPPTLPQNILISSDGADEHLCKMAAVTKITHTDTAITGNIRTGVYMGGQTRGDNFAAQDLVALAAPTLRVVRSGLVWR